MVSDRGDKLKVAEGSDRGLYPLSHLRGRFLPS